MKIISVGTDRRATVQDLVAAMAACGLLVLVALIALIAKKNPPAPEQPQWTIIHSDQIMNSSYTYAGYKEFAPVSFGIGQGVPVRFSLRGRFASANANSKLVVLDPENYQRWVKREPFFPLAVFAPMQPINLMVKPMPGFVIVDPPPETPSLDLSSVGAALLSLVKMRAAQQPRESQATIDLTLVSEAYVTPSQAKAIIGGKQK